MFGNIGGFIGLLLGYSLLQIPELLLLLSTKVIDQYLKRNQLKTSNKVDIIHPILVQERQANDKDNHQHHLEDNIAAKINILKKEHEETTKK